MFSPVCQSWRCWMASQSCPKTLRHLHYRPRKPPPCAIFCDSCATDRHKYFYKYLKLFTYWFNIMPKTALSTEMMMFYEVMLWFYTAVCKINTFYLNMLVYLHSFSVHVVKCRELIYIHTWSPQVKSFTTLLSRHIHTPLFTAKDTTQAWMTLFLLFSWLGYCWEKIMMVLSSIKHSYNIWNSIKGHNAQLYYYM